MLHAKIGPVLRVNSSLVLTLTIAPNLDFRVGPVLNFRCGTFPDFRISQVVNFTFGPPLKFRCSQFLTSGIGRLLHFWVARALNRQIVGGKVVSMVATALYGQQCTCFASNGARRSLALPLPPLRLHPCWLAYCVLPAATCGALPIVYVQWGSQGQTQSLFTIGSPGAAYFMVLGSPQRQSKGSTFLQCPTSHLATPREIERPGPHPQGWSNMVHTNIRRQLVLT